MCVLLLCDHSQPHLPWHLHELHDCWDMAIHPNLPEHPGVIKGHTQTVMPISPCTDGRTSPKAASPSELYDPAASRARATLAPPAMGTPLLRAALGSAAAGAAAPSGAPGLAGCRAPDGPAPPQKAAYQTSSITDKSAQVLACCAELVSGICTAKQNRRSGLHFERNMLMQQ